MAFHNFITAMVENGVVKKLFPLLNSVELLHEIEKQGIYKEVKAGETVMEYGQFIKSVPLIISGLVKVMRNDEEGRELFLYYLYPGETCAMSLTCCMTNQRSEIRAVAEEDTSFIAIPIQYLDKWMNEYPDWKNLVMQTYSLRFRDLLNTIDNIAFRNMDERLEEYLYAKSKAAQSNTLNITHQEIATELSTSREVISRLLKQMEKKGKIQLGRNKLEIVDI
jgi:CRP/FNR family transcriptional regulator, anaerobic regulatory protein